MRRPWTSQKTNMANDNRLQSESKLPFDAGELQRFVGRQTEYPRVTSNVVRTGAVQKPMAVKSGDRTRENHTEEHGPDENLGMKWVRPNEINHTSTQKFK